MGWRDRVKKSFAYSADIAEGIQNLKKTEKKRKEGLKTTFIHLTHNTQNTQNRQNESEKPKAEPEQANTTREVKKESTPPAGSTLEYKKLWAEAWTLADWIDDSRGAPIEERRARLPELMLLCDRMAEIEKTYTKN